MNTGNLSDLTEIPAAEAALLDLCKPFAPAFFEPRCAVVQPDEIPFPADQLLVHHTHMTEVLERHHGRPVEVSVLEEHRKGHLYSRKISLAPRGSDRVVEWGIVRLNLKYISDEVCAEILEKKLPLGAVLIKHDVHRRVKPRWFVRFPGDGPVLGLFGAREPEPVYGRLGTIYCDEEPAIELLEIVTGITTAAAPNAGAGGFGTNGR
jgi:hypothetical protein